MLQPPRIESVDGKSLEALHPSATISGNPLREAVNHADQMSGNPDCPIGHATASGIQT